MPKKSKSASQLPRHFHLAVVTATILTAAAFICTQAVQNSKNFHVDQAQAAEVLPTGQIGQSANWNLLPMSDEFTGTTQDTTKWSNCIHWAMLDTSNPSAGCWENLANNWEWYLPRNVTIANGLADIQTKKETLSNTKGTFNYTSGMLSGDNSNGVPKKSFTYGLVEMRAKLPKGQGIWPAFWMLDANSTGDYEIDAMELLGNEPAKMYMNYHWKNSSGVMQQNQTDFALTGTDFSADYHTFAIDWEPEAITWYVDGVARKTFTPANGSIYNGPMYILANTQVGSTNPNSWPGAPDASTVFPVDYSIDYVRVWQKGSAVTPTTIPTVAPSTAPTPTSVPTTTQLLINPSFESTTGTGLEPWTLDLKKGYSGTIGRDSATATDGTYSAVINVAKKSTTDWNVQLTQNLAITQGKAHTIKFMAKTATPHTIGIVIQQNYGSYTEYYHQNVTLTTGWAEYTLPSYTPTFSDANTKLSFSLATQTGKVWFDQMSITAQ